MPNAPPWNPAGNAVHHLVQLIDVLAIAFNRFRQLSFKLPHHRDARYQPERQRLWDDYFAVRRAIFPAADIAPQHTAARRGHAAVAELARRGSTDEARVRDAQRWLTELGWGLVPHVAPFEPHSGFWKPFNGKGHLLSQHTRPAGVARRAGPGRTDHTR